MSACVWGIVAVALVYGVGPLMGWLIPMSPTEHQPEHCKLGE